MSLNSYEMVFTNKGLNLFDAKKNQITPLLVDPTSNFSLRMEFRGLNGKHFVLVSSEGSKPGWKKYQILYLQPGKGKEAIVIKSLIEINDGPFLESTKKASYSELKSIQLEDNGAELNGKLKLTIEDIDTTKNFTTVRDQIFLLSDVMKKK